MGFFKGLCRLGCKAPAVMLPLDCVGAYCFCTNSGNMLLDYYFLGLEYLSAFDQHLGERNFIVPLVWY